MVPVEQVFAGDVLRRPSGVVNVVTRVCGPFEDGTRVVVYGSYEEATYEWKARDRSGFNLRADREGKPIAVERSWKPLREGELVPLEERGRADLLAEMLRALELAADARPSPRHLVGEVSL